MLDSEMIGFLGLPAADMYGNAGTGSPGEREIRYREYNEKQLSKGGKKDG